MRLRWPFRLALVGLVLGLAAWVAAPAVADAWRKHQEERRTAAWAAQLKPAWRVLSTMPDPAGLTASALNKSTGFTPMLIWRGAIAPHRAALRFRDAMVSVGASEAQVRCRVLADDGSTFCRVDARVAGTRLTANLVPGRGPSGGLDQSSTQIGIDLGLDWPLSDSWTDVPVE